MKQQPFKPDIARSTEAVSPDSSPVSLDTETLPKLARPLAAGEVALKVGDRSERASFELKDAVDGVSDLLVTAQSAAGRFATALWVAASTLAKKPAVSAAAAALGLGSAVDLTHAALMPDGSDPLAYMSLGNEFAGSKALSFRVLVPGFGSGERDTSATYLNNGYAITAAHNVVDLLSYNPTYEVATGENYLTDRGTVVAVQSVTVYPGYDGTFNTPDLAIIKFATSLTAPSNTIASASIGEVITAAGFGHPGTPTSGSLPQDGAVRGWNAPVVDGNPNNISDTYYMSTDFSPYTGLSLNGKGLSGDSGGPEFDAAGNLVGISIAQQGNTDPTGSTVFLNLSQPDIEAWIDANTDVPEPSLFAVVTVASAGLLMRKRR